MSSKGKRDFKRVFEKFGERANDKNGVTYVVRTENDFIMC